MYAFITPKFNINTVESINYYDNKGNSLFNAKEQNYTKLEDISDNVKNAIISVEDKNFYHQKNKIRSISPSNNNIRPYSSNNSPILYRSSI